MSTYAIIPSKALPTMDWQAMKSAAIDTVRRSTDGTLAVVEWDGDTPPCVANCPELVGIYAYEEMLPMMDTPPWKIQNGPL